VKNIYKRSKELNTKLADKLRENEAQCTQLQLHSVSLQSEIQKTNKVLCEMKIRQEKSHYEKIGYEWSLNNLDSQVTFLQTKNTQLFAALDYISTSFKLGQQY